MKKSGLLLTILCLPLLLWAGTITKTFTFNADELVFQKVSGYDLVTLPNCLNTYEIGSPLLPIALYTVCVPANATVTKVEVLSRKQVEIPGEYLIYPVQPGIPLNLTGPVPFQEPNPLIYSSAEPYPKELVSYSPTGSKAGYRLCDFILYPLQYFPQAQKLVLHTDLEVRITYQEGTITPKELTLKQVELFGKEVRRLVINPDDVAQFAPPRRNTLQGDLEYVIITSDAFVSNFQPLADWRTKMGLKAEVKTTTWIYANYTGYDNPERIRNFIIDQFQNHGLIYVVLAGDVAVVPVRNVRISYSGYTYDAPSDWYFADLDGSWDGNHNHIWGERVGDSLDLYADVYVGRAPIDNITQANGFVNKVFTYEKNPDPNYIKKVLLPCVMLFSQYNYHGRIVSDSIANITPSGWIDSYIIDATTTTPMQDSINAGFHFCHVAAHGNVTIMGDQSGHTIYNSSTAQSQTNATKLGIFNSIACDCGYFDYSSYDCLAEECINNPNGGFIGVIMNAREGWGSPPSAGPSERLDIRFYDFIFNHDTVTLGPAHYRSKEFYRSLILSDALWHFCALELNLLGEPALLMWTESPQSLTVNFPAVVPIGTSTLTVNVTSGGFPVANALVCALKPNEVYTTGRTNSAGSVDLTITPLTPGELYITVTGHNCYPFEDSALVRSSGAYVAHLRHLIDDVAGGNGDGIVNPGENIEMPTWVKNWGNLTAENVIGKLTSSCPNVTLTDTLKDFGTILAGDSAFTGADGYNFTVAPGCTNGYLIPLRLVCRDQNDSIWQSNINILVGTCVLNYANKIVYDPAPGGNNNRRIDPGESAELVIVLRNTGLGNGYNVSAILKSGDTRLTVLDSVGTFGTIYRDTTGTNETDRFTILA
ncbi:MAG: C25 family cysteine peptidase, partial [candidate division WOR-3 bacterium]